MTDRKNSSPETAFLNTLLRPAEIALARQLFAAEPDPEEIRFATGGLDLDSEHIVNQIALARLSFKVDKDLLPAGLVPRVRGIHRYYQAQTAFNVVWLEKKIALLREKGIPVMLLKGMAMYAYFDAGHPRLMADSDIAVPEDRFAEAKQIMFESGLLPAHAVESLHSIDLYEGEPGDRKNHRELDLHHRIFKRGNDSGTDIWERSHTIPFRGQTVRVLSTEDMLISLIDNETRDIFLDEPPEKRLKLLIDVRTLMEREDAPSPEKIKQRAEELKEGFRVRLLMKFYAQCFPDVFEKEQIDRLFPETERYRRWLKTELAFMELRRDKSLNAAEEGRSVRQLGRLVKRLVLDYRRQKLDTSPNAWDSFYGYLKRHYRVDSFGTMLKNTFRRLRI